MLFRQNLEYPLAKSKLIPTRSKHVIKIFIINFAIFTFIKNSDNKWNIIVTGFKLLISKLSYDIFTP